LQNRITKFYKSVLYAKMIYENIYKKPIKAIKMSQLTFNDLKANSKFLQTNIVKDEDIRCCGMEIKIDNNLPYFEFKIMEE